MEAFQLTIPIKAPYTWVKKLPGDSKPPTMKIFPADVKTSWSMDRTRHSCWAKSEFLTHWIYEYNNMVVVLCHYMEAYCSFNALVTTMDRSPLKITQAEVDKYLLMNLKDSRKQLETTVIPVTLSTSQGALFLLRFACPLHVPHGRWNSLVYSWMSHMWPHGFPTVAPSYIIIFEFYVPLQTDGQFYVS